MNIAVRITRILRTLPCIVALVAAQAWCQEPSPQEAAARLKLQLSTGQIAEATALAEQIQRDPALRSASAELLMLQGAVWQEQVRRTSDANEKAGALAKARQAYTEALKRSPESGAIMNNLALLEVAAGNDAAARAMFEAAVASKDPRKPSYALNYASYLQPRDPSAARGYAAMAVKAAPENASARELLISLYKTSPRSELVGFLSAEFDAGRTSSVLRTAIDVLVGDGSSAAGGADQLMAFVAAAIAADPVLLSAGPGTEVLGKLNGLAQDSAVSLPARQLQLALNGRARALSELNWWTDSARVALKNYPTRKSVIRSLLRGLGESRLRSTPQAAEQWLRLAIDAGDQGPDPDAFLRLVELYLNDGQRAKINELMARYEYELFTEKGAAYARQDWPLIYKMHLALGTTYAYLGQWENNAQPIQSATFQLENAKKAAERGNAVLRQKNLPQTLALPAQSAQQLSDYYVRKGDARKAVTIQLDVARQLHAAARPNESKELLTTVDAATLKTMGAPAESGYKTLRADVDRAAMDATARRK